MLFETAWTDEKIKFPRMRKPSKEHSRDLPTASIVMAVAAASSWILKSMPATPWNSRRYCRPAPDAQSSKRPTLFLNSINGINCCELLGRNFITNQQSGCWIRHLGGAAAHLLEHPQDAATHAIPLSSLQNGKKHLAPACRSAIPCTMRAVPHIRSAVSRCRQSGSKQLLANPAIRITNSGS